MPNGSDIIIKGGSVEVVFDEGIYLRSPSNSHSNGNDEKKITRVTITGDLNFDSGDKAQGWGCVITVHCN